jgi:hypothetical protein
MRTGEQLKITIPTVHLLKCFTCSAIFACGLLLTCSPDLLIRLS